jgi:DNA uptake protein ComE-like DNA-binding protein
MRARTGFKVLAGIVLFVTVAGLSQNQERDRPGQAKTSRPGSAPAPEARVDINHASLAELEKIPGMTTTWAARVVRFRPYRTKLDLMEKGVVNSQVYDRIKGLVIAHQKQQ